MISNFKLPGKYLPAIRLFYLVPCTHLRAALQRKSLRKNSRDIVLFGLFPRTRVCVSISCLIDVYLEVGNY